MAPTGTADSEIFKPLSLPGRPHSVAERPRRPRPPGHGAAAASPTGSPTGSQAEAAGSESRVRVRLRRCDYPQPLSVALGLHRDRGPSPSESGLNRDLKFDWAVTIQRTQIQAAESDLLPLAAPGRASLSSQ